MSNETIFIDFFQSVANFPGSKSNSKNIDPKSESSFARFFSNETIFNFLYDEILISDNEMVFFRTSNQIV